MTATHACMWTHVLGPALKKKSPLLYSKKENLRFQFQSIYLLILLTYLAISLFLLILFYKCEAL